MEESTKKERHHTKLDELGLLPLPPRKNKQKCAALSGSETECEAAGCAYQKAGYLSSALCYDPETEVPGVFWGVWEKQQTGNEKEDKEVVKELSQIEPPTQVFQSAKDYEDAKAQKTGVSSIVFSKRQARIIDDMQRRGKKIYEQLKYKKAFEKPDASFQTYKITKSGKRVPISVNLTPGDHIFSTGGFGQDFIEHHGVYIGRGYIVEVGGGGRVLLNLELGLGDLMCGLGLRSSPSKGVVTLNHISSFVDPRYRAGVIVYDQKDRLPREETVRRAIEKIGEWNYKLFTSNCEHFATYAVTGRFDSAQLQKIEVFKPLNKALRWISPSQYGVVENCSIAFGSEKCVAADCPHVLLECGSAKKSCHCLAALGKEIQKQQERGEIPHDPESGYLLTPDQVQRIASAAFSQ